LTAEDKIKALDSYKEQLLKKLAEKIEINKAAEKDSLVDRIITKVKYSLLFDLF